jgi:uncharacterized Fe-S cluster-containing radical SAM superfamily protein
MPSINTNSESQRLRERSIRVESQELLITRLDGSKQETDITEPVNCDGFGRVRSFQLRTSAGWQPNTLPIQPACRALGIEPSESIRVQVFQNAACNWRCWYCYVPFSLLAADERRAGWLTAGQMVDFYLAEQNRPDMIDLSGGQPDLVPEWIPWMMEAVLQRNLQDEIFLWSDDNLSNDYFWQYLSTSQQELVRDYKNYGKVCCFKGFDNESFAFNTSAEPELFDRQFSLMKSYVDFGLNVYGYVTFTSPNRGSIGDAVPRFVDRLQSIHTSLPLRVIPLEIQEYSTMVGRTKEVHKCAISNQHLANELWVQEIKSRFSAEEQGKSICDVNIGASANVK